MAEKNLEQMKEAVAEIREKMAAAAREAGRDPAAVQLCAACKTRTAQTVAESAALPIDVFGENHVQELCANFDAGAYCGKPSHFIGHLQTNKIKKVLGRASLIQSVDSEHLLNAIEKEAARAGIVQNVLLEVNIGGEESKTGVAPEALWPLLDAAAAQEHIRVKGLMAIPPVNDDDARNRRYLAEVYKLFVQAGERGYSNVSMETLSMGMSGDFENAIREGATLVRIGTAIYGERDYSKKQENEPSPSLLRNATSPERGRFCTASRKMQRLPLSEELANEVSLRGFYNRRNHVKNQDQRPRGAPRRQRCADPAFSALSGKVQNDPVSGPVLCGADHPV